jgi:lysyl-tRNA synthetase, class II
MTMVEAFDDYQQRRHEKAVLLREQGMEPYPLRSERTHTTTEAIALLTESREGEEPGSVTVAGRVMAIRLMGKAAFLHIEDGAGRVQIYLRRDQLGEESYDLFKAAVDLGDFLQVSGTMFYTRTQEPTVQGQSWKMLSKAINQPPEKWHGLSDVEQRYRQRYVDLLANEEVRNLFIKRSRITSLVRLFMEDRGFLEMETPILQPIYGGAAARPFVTHHNWAKRDLYLRIADELYLKRLLVGGLERVFEIGRDFRNEGISHKHNPEFTMMEAYQAYADYRDMMELVEQCWSYVCSELHGSTLIAFGEHEIDLAPPWRRVTMRDAILERTSIDIYSASTLDALRAAIEEQALRIDNKPTWGTQIDELFSQQVEPHLVQPTLIIDYPYELSPFAKQTTGNPQIVERFEAFLAGMEVANAFTELNDPLEQWERFRDQQRQADEGDEEAQPLDEDFLNALMYGMPPTGGIGWGMDRMAMVLLNQHSIREVILFPQLRQR